MAEKMGRKRRTEEDWRQIVREQAASGLSSAAWCQQRGLVASTFHWWRGELARRDAQRAQATFVPVQVQPGVLSPEPGSIEILLTGGRRIRLCGPVDRRVLAEVVAVLEGAAC